MAMRATNCGNMVGTRITWPSHRHHVTIPPPPRCHHMARIAIKSTLPRHCKHVAIMSSLHDTMWPTCCLTATTALVPCVHIGGTSHCWHLDITLPSRRVHIAIVFSSRRRRVASTVPAGCRHVANALQSCGHCCRHIANKSQSHRHRVASMLP